MRNEWAGFRLRKRWRFLSSVATAAFLFTGHARAEGWIDFEPSVLASDNLTRAADRADRRADRALALNVSGGHVFALFGTDIATATIDLRRESYARYRALDHWVFGGAATYRHKFGLGAEVPWLLGSVYVARERYRGELRDGDRLRVQIEAGQRLGRRADGAIGATYERRHGDYDVAPGVPGYSGRVFDLAGTSTFARLGLNATDRWFLSALMRVRRGQVESTAQQGPAVFVASDAIAFDPAFGDPSLFAYRLRATTYSTVVAASFAASDSTSLNMTIADNRTRAADGLSYVDRTVALSLIYRYP